jgi:putative nucleotidyltransferase with HDIG domain
MTGTTGSGTVVASTRAGEARDLARVLLADEPERWQHTVGVARRAEELARTVGDESDLLVAAAWLHDVGYAAVTRDTGFHPLDGARYLDRNHWPARLCALVAHHSGAWFVASLHGLDDALQAYPHEVSVVSDALTYADQTVGPAGRRMTIMQRMAEMLDRHGPESASARAHHLRRPYLLAIADRVERRLRSA